MTLKAKKRMHSSLLEQFLPELDRLAHQGSIIDVACGEGRNGLYLANKGLPVTFADKSETCLKQVESELTSAKSHIWPVDLEQSETNPFNNKTFSAALVFRYLHRPLIPHLMNAIIPGGIIIYETFTLENKAFGRPNNPDFLLKPLELTHWFNDWETLHYFEGVLSFPDRAVAQIVCQKPMNSTRKNDNK